MNDNSAKHLNDPNLSRILISETVLRDRIAEIGAQISHDYAGREILMVGVLKGAFLFMADLAREVTVPVQFDFMAVSSYGSATKTSGVVRILKDLDIDLAGRDVLIVEDIIDSGLTLSYLLRNLKSRNPASLTICSLLVKDTIVADELDLKYVGFNIPNEFVVGYGLDVAERYRNLPFIAIFQENQG
jgi:hypoxanthine phosphoribosyltransferase